MLTPCELLGAHGDVIARLCAQEAQRFNQQGGGGLPVHVEIAPDPDAFARRWMRVSMRRRRCPCPGNSSGGAGCVGVGIEEGQGGAGSGEAAARQDLCATRGCPPTAALKARRDLRPAGVRSSVAARIQKLISPICSKLISMVSSCSGSSSLSARQPGLQRRGRRASGRRRSGSVFLPRSWRKLAFGRAVISADQAVQAAPVAR